MRRNAWLILAAAAVVIVTASLSLGSLRFGGERPASSSSSTPAPSASSEPAYDPERAEAEKETIRRTVTSFVSGYYSFYPGRTWQEVRLTVKPEATSRLLDQEHDREWLPVDDLELQRTVRHDVDVVLESLTGEYDQEADATVLYMLLGVTSYDKKDEVASHKTLAKQLRVSLIRSEDGRWLVDDLSLTD